MIASETETKFLMITLLLGTAALRTLEEDEGLKIKRYSCYLRFLFNCYYNLRFKFLRLGHYKKFVLVSSNNY